MRTAILPMTVQTAKRSAVTSKRKNAGDLYRGHLFTDQRTGVEVCYHALFANSSSPRAETASGRWRAPAKRPAVGRAIRWRRSHCTVGLRTGRERRS
jgi:hypothetical protein